MTTTTSPSERAVSAVFPSQDQIDQVIRRLLERGVAKDDISVMGKNFESETRISGFITKKDVILQGLKQGGIFGSLFGSALGLLTGIGVLFIPFVGTVVAGGRLGALLLGAASGAIAGSAGAGLASALVTLGMPEDKAAIYQTRVKAGDFLLIAEVAATKTGEIQMLLENQGGEEVMVSEAALPRQQPGPIQAPDDLSPEVRNHLSQDAQQTYIEHYNNHLQSEDDPMKAEQVAWDAIHEQYEVDDNGIWSKSGKTSQTAG